MVTRGNFLCEYYGGMGYQWPGNGGKQKLRNLLSKNISGLMSND